MTNWHTEKQRLWGPIATSPPQALWWHFISQTNSVSFSLCFLHPSICPLFPHLSVSVRVCLSCLSGHFIFLIFLSLNLRRNSEWVKKNRTAAIMKLILNFPSLVVSSELCWDPVCITYSLRQSKMERLWCGTLLSFITILI